MPIGPVEDAHMKAELTAEILGLEEKYLIMRRYLSGEEFDPLEIVGSLHAFKTGLDRISAQILAIYELKGHRTKITWESLIENLSNASDTLRGFRGANPRPAIQAALDMSSPSIEEVMAYLSKLKISLQ